ncbi:C4b-binding protein alpha chain [Cebus imitator]|uniref:Complement component 4 binding protein alpha n=1 Tax=Cebus imitator TaxID=2715852 RepID=A0A2K5PFU7_CEBIM|nr:C4b-binding protein alpha chain [Cebus imitator]XP_017381005.1 C4b-binding protein alpha chain [Cebus imitator]
MRPSRTPPGTLHRKGKMAAWPFFRLWKVSDPILFQMTLVAALLPTVLGNCGPPPTLSFAVPVNTTLAETQFETGTSLKYTCRPGYAKSSSNQMLTCNSDGQWIHTIFCTHKRCRNPGDLPNGQVEIKTDLSFGSQIEFSCSEGYFLIGSTTSHCALQDRGVDWSHPLPQCEIVKCEPPPDIKNGRHSSQAELYTYGSSVTYSCDSRFSLVGQASISCTVENKTIGVWSPSPPTCEKVFCHKPDVPHGNIVSGFRTIYKYKDTIVFNCEKGFVLSGSSVIHCEVGNEWSPSPPVCEPNGCTNLPDIPHAMWEGYPRPSKEDVHVVGTVLRYRCHPGYKPATDAPTTVTCQKNLRWTPFQGCEVLCCPEPKLSNDQITTQRKRHSANGCVYFYGDEISYSCHKNSWFSWNSAICQEDGTWSPRTPSCEDNCNFPPRIAHGRYKKAKSFAILSDDILYECDEGYILDGEARLSCRDSRWSSAAPQCKALCLKPELVNGRLSVNKNQYVESENVTIQCDSGYGVVGPQIITCSGDRTWYPEVPRCEWETPEGCEQVLAGKNLMQCLPNPGDVKMALELYKLSLEIKQLELQRDRERQSTLDKEL